MSNQPLKILIPNATSPKNLGDFSTLQELLRLITNNLSQSNITVHSYDPELYPVSFANKVDHALYDWVAFENTNVAVRIFRLCELFLNYVGILKTGKIALLLNDYKNADVIFFVNGGYLRTKPGFTQTVNLLMQLMMFIFAKKYTAKKIVAPISFGPFAYVWQEKLAARCLQNLDLVYAREEISLTVLKKYSIKNVLLASDLALLITKYFPDVDRDKKVFTVGLTLRKWLDADLQNKLEQNIFASLKDFCKLYGIRIQPITQVNSPEYGDNDLLLVEDMSSSFKASGIEVLPIAIPITVEGLLSTYSSLDMLLGMRTHSNILAATQGVPSVAISYEYKTEGIMDTLGMIEYCIKCKEVDQEKIYNLLVKAYDNHRDLQNTIARKLEDIRKIEKERWNELCRTLLAS